MDAHLFRTYNYIKNKNLYYLKGTFVRYYLKRTFVHCLESRNYLNFKLMKIIY